MTTSVATTAAHALTIGTMNRGLKNLAAIMDKAEQHAKSSNVALETLLQARLYPDMMNLLQQIQYVCFLSIDFARHFSSKEAPKLGYDEETWEQLRKSLSEAANYLGAIKENDVAAKAGAVVPTFMDDSKGMTALNYAADVIVPDFHFHMVVAYALLRHNGVPLGKSDFLGKLQMEPLPAN